MSDRNDAQIISRDHLPTSVVSQYTFLKEMGSKLGEDQAIKVKADGPKNAKIIQSRWRYYFKKRAHSRRETRGSVIHVFLWLDTEKKE